MLTSFDADGIPLSYLRAYPLPAFVVELPRRQPELQRGHAAAPTTGLSPPRDAAGILHPTSNGKLRGLQDGETAVDDPRLPPRKSAAPTHVDPPSAPCLVWGNDPYDSITLKRPLDELIDPTALSAFQAWLQEERAAPPTFFLQIAEPDVALHLVKTMHVGKKFTYAVVTTFRDTNPLAGGTDSSAASLASSPSSSVSSSNPYASASGALRDQTTPDRPPLMSRFSSRHRAGLNRPLSPSPSNSAGPISSIDSLEPYMSCARLLQETDWGSTLAGPMKDWPPEVHSMIRLVFTSSDQDSVWVGRDMRLVYNEASTQTMDHPRSFGARIEDVWKLFWPELKPLVDRAWKGEPVFRDSDRILLEIEGERGGPPRFLEKYHSFSFLPIMDSNKNVIAIYNPTADDTARILAERRLETTKELLENISFAPTPKQLFQAVAGVLKNNPADAPFVICYSVSEKESVDFSDKGPHDFLVRKRSSDNTHSNPSSSRSPSSTMSGSTALPAVEFKQVTLQLESSVGVPEGHKSAPSHQSLTIPVGSLGRAAIESHHSGTDGRDSAEPLWPSAPLSHLGSRENEEISCDGLEWPIAQALATRQCVVVHDIGELIEGLPVRQWNSLPDTAVIIPLISDSSNQTPQGVMILGLNLYRPLDLEYGDWVQQIRVHTTAALNSAVANERELKRRIDREKLDRAKTAWFRGVAQEFRSPLSLISGPLEELSNHAKDLSSKQAKRLHMAKKNVFKLEQLVSSLLNFSKIELGRFKIHYFLNNLKLWLKELFVVFKPTIGKIGHLKFVLEVDDVDRKDKELIYFDPVLLEMVVSNLLSYSTKKCGQREHPTTVTLKLEFDKKYANISVIDKGDEEDERSSSLYIDSTTDWFKHPEGDDGESDGEEEDEALGTSSSISLALVKEIVRLHKGHFIIESRSDHNQGNTMTARIPLKYHLTSDETGIPVTLPRTVEEEEYENAEEKVFQGPFGVYGKQVAQELSDWNEDFGSSIADSEGGSNVEGLMFEKDDLVLVIDEDRDTRDYIGDIFAPYCTVLEASDGYQALEAIQSGRKPNIIICDLLMGKMPGLDFLSELRATPSTHFIPLVFLSPVDDDDLRVSAFVAGAEDFILKPFKPKELLLRAHVHSQIGKKAANLEDLFSQRTQEMAVLSDYCPSGILRSDCYGNITYANEAFREPAGMDLGSIPNDWISYVCPEQAASFEKSWQNLLHGSSSPTTTKLEWKWKTGKTMSGTFINLNKLNNRLDGILACVTDISYKEDMLREAEDRRREAEESQRRQELLVDFTSHEIRTPVSAILQCSSLAKDNLCSLMEQLEWSLKNNIDFVPTPQILSELAEDVEALESIYMCGTLQERIANDILSLARIQLDVLSVHEVEMDVQLEAQKKLSVFATEARMRDIVIDLKFDKSFEKLGVYGIKSDPTRLGQVMTNLISNAIRFISNSQARRISVTELVSYEPPLEGTTRPPPSAGLAQQYPVPPPEDTPLYLYVTVADTGPGMIDTERHLLFQRFQQCNHMIHTRYGGSGLGLFICKKITEMLGGDISVDSQLGVGTTFNFYIKTRSVSPKFARGSEVQDGAATLALAAPPPAPKSDPVTSQRKTAPSNGAPKPALGKPGAVNGSAMPDKPSSIHVLIVEDNIINQTVLKRQLTKAGMLCDVAGNGEEALEQLYRTTDSDGASEPYDVVLMDLEMPVMDGWTAISTIRASSFPALRDQLVIALTGNAREGQIEQALKAGMDHVVIKPYRLDALIAKMHDAISEQSRRTTST